jgi:DNA-binding transcriptional LysR family regulator
MSLKDGLDSHLLRVLFTLINEKNVSRTAVKLNTSQPAISTALKRLREITGDELLVRAKNGMAPTEFALSLHPHLRGAIDAIERISQGVPGFHPLRSRRQFRIASPDYMDSLFLPQVVASIRREAPKTVLHVRALNPDYDFERLLEDGELDVVIGNWPDPPDHLHMEPLWEDDLVVLMRRDHPLSASTLTQDQYLKAHHLAPTPYAVSQRGLVDVFLGRERMVRHVAVTVPYFSMAPHMLLHTDLLFTTNRRFAEHYAGLLALKVLESPVKFPRMKFYALWHERSNAAEDCQWLRSVIANTAKNMLGGLPAPASLDAEPSAAPTAADEA